MAWDSNGDTVECLPASRSEKAMMRIAAGTLSPEAQIGRSYNGRGLARHPQEIFRKKVLDTENGF